MISVLNKKIEILHFNIEQEQAIYFPPKLYTSAFPFEFRIFLQIYIVFT